MTKSVNELEMTNEIKKLLEVQKDRFKNTSLTEEDIKDIVFGEDDVVEQYLGKNDISEDDIDLGLLRELQHDMIAELF